jgi:preprotein translocase subunit SecF
MHNILGKRYLFFLFSLILIVPGFIVLGIKGVPLSIDFVGGNLLEVKFSSGKAPLQGDVVELLNGFASIKDVQVTSTGEDTLIIRYSLKDINATDNPTSAQLRSSIQSKFPEFGDPVERRYDAVGPTVGQEVTNRAILAVAVAALGVVLFITFAFRGIQHAFRYGICAIIAMLHDVLVVLSLAIIGSNFWGWQIDSLFLTALLTVIGFSVQDKIVVFDRIRENSSIFRRLPFEKLANHSIVQTLQRSINTQLMTSEFMLLALALFGGVTMREFAVILLVGLAMGTYSSIFIAASALVVWENKEWRYWFKGKEKLHLPNGPQA